MPPPSFPIAHTSFFSFLSIANASIDGGNLKSHVLRFLGMYNVVDLLTFTIGAQYLLEEKKELPMKENIFDLVICFICALSCVLSGVGMTISTIVYNSASSVSGEWSRPVC